MEDDLMLGLCIIKVLCLIVIAMSVHKMAYANEYFEGSFVDGCKAGVDPRYCGETSQSHFNNAEAPVFWNAGSFSTIDSALQTAAGQAERDVGVYNQNVATGAAYAANVAAANAAAAAAASTSGFDNYPSAQFTMAMNGM